jgi:hypothetical protein
MMGEATVNVRVIVTVLTPLVAVTTTVYVPSVA